MRLPKPADTLADCVWLPRIMAKGRLFHAGQLPPDYAARFGHASGVDGQFLGFFGLTREDILTVCDRSDVDVAKWFTLDPARRERIPQWNHIALNLGRPGFPMADRLPIALATTYQHLAGRPFETVFHVLEADEQDSV